MIFNINIDTINIESFPPAKCSRHVTYHLTSSIKHYGLCSSKTCYVIVCEPLATVTKAGKYCPSHISNHSADFYKTCDL